MLARAPSPDRSSAAPETLPTRERGVAIVEMTFVMIVVAVLAAVSVPSVVNFLVAERLRSAGTDLVASLQVARTEAMRRNGSVTVRPVADGWTTGWVVAPALGDPIERRNALGKRVVVARAPAAVVFGPNGRLDRDGVALFQFSDAEATPGISPRCVIVDASGDPRVEMRSCD